VRSCGLAAEDKVSGAQCLMHGLGQQGLKGKDKGGLGVRDIGVRNKCVLLKIIHRMYSPPEGSSWAA
jgi:hypothetical protein